MIMIPVYNMIILPNISLTFKKDFFDDIVSSHMSVGDEVLFLFQKTEKNRKNLTGEDFFPVGLSGRVESIDDDGDITVRTQERMNLSDIHTTATEIFSEAHVRLDISDVSEEDKKAIFEVLKSRIVEFLQKFPWGLMARAYANRWKSVEECATALSAYLNLDADEKYKILEADQESKRYELIEKAIYGFIAVSDVSTEAQEHAKETNEKLYREDALKKQIVFLQNQLDQMHPENISDITRFQQKIEKSGMNETARREADKVLGRMKQEGKDSHEYGLLYDYLDFMTSLDWKKANFKKIDLTMAHEILDEDHYGLKKVKNRIIQQLAVMSLNRKQSGSILLFVGAPGTGKTSIGQSIAKALGREYVRISLGGVRDEAEIRGHRRTYIGAMPGRIMNAMKNAGTSNPVIVLDEVDKLSHDYNGDPSSALLEVLDPEQNFSFTDHYMNVPYDLSDVLFVCTANTTDTIPEPLQNRMEAIQFPGYTSVEKFQIARRHLLPKAMKAAGITEDDLEVTDEAIRAVIDGFTMESGVRGLKKQIDTLCRYAAVEIVEGREKATKKAARYDKAREADKASETDAINKDVNAAESDEASEGSGADKEYETRGDRLEAESDGASEGSGADKEYETRGDRLEAESDEASEGSGADKEYVDSEEHREVETDKEDRRGKRGKGSKKKAGVKRVVVKAKDLRKYLDQKPIHHDSILEEKRAGIVTGLAWTAAGGEILFIETLFTKGSGKVIITGQLGDVMKESVQIAISLVKAMYPDKEKLFEENDLHIHVPEGAVPKDGPSAGITLTTALSSLVTGREVSPKWAMTGEVSLRGGIMPIGGLPEKLMAAQRAGITRVFIPKENAEDLDEVADEVKKSLSIYPVKKVSDVLVRLGLQPQLPEKKNKKGSNTSKKKTDILDDPYGYMEAFWGERKSPVTIRPF